jgi:hypothetical protein
MPSGPSGNQYRIRRLADGQERIAVEAELAVEN